MDTGFDSFFPPRHSPNRSKRLRKKLMIEEFKALGFHVNFEWNTPLSPEQFDVAYDQFIGEGLVDHGLEGGGGTDNKTAHFFVMRKGQKNATEEDRVVLEGWLSRQPYVKSFVVGKLIDAQYDEPDA